MNSKKLYFLLLSALILAVHLCSCRAPAESETETYIETEEPKIETSPEEQVKDTPQMLFEIVSALLPAEDTAPDPNYEKKIDPEIYDSYVFDNGKYLIYMTRKSPPDDLSGAVKMEFNRLYGTAIEDRQVTRALHTTAAARFAARYIEDVADVVYSGGYTSSFILYATAEEIEKYARSSEVAWISAWDEGYPITHPDNMPFEVPDYRPSTTSDLFFLNAVGAYKHQANQK